VSNTSASPYDALAEAGTMDLDGLDGGTSPFITLDACDGTLVTRMVPALEAAAIGDNTQWCEMIEENPSVAERLTSQGIESPSDRSSIVWDDPTLLFTATIVLTSEGRALPLGDGKARERIGRFPYGDGSPISYMIEYMRPNHQRSSLTQRIGMDEILDLLNKLNHGLSDQHIGHHRYNEGNAGMDIRGYLSAEEVRTLRLGLAGRGWSVTADEPLDGGMRDASKNLIAVLRAAERRDVGVFLRSHS
jgi:hypothetical protein